MQRGAMRVDDAVRRPQPAEIGEAMARARQLGHDGRAAVEREYTIARLAERYLSLTEEAAQRTAHAV